jgi:hypothetical protein
MAFCPPAMLPRIPVRKGLAGGTRYGVSSKASAFSGLMKSCVALVALREHMRFLYSLKC